MTWTVKVRVEAFRQAAHRAEFTSAYALGNAMEVERSTVIRVLNGEMRPGPAFIGGALRALKPMAFEHLFEVVRKTL
ncbi:transcriptional regulator [Saccharothrix algeriensis]|uniref:HTH cro/C1-type domain-containing protein n=1 Tax=Saccharothrix algeriensis TaxID=173560 RepID=A0ABS2S6Z9_9PSEU|nr:transcriptional regulator [Saccharothrix algeriensis]MBM7811058.1 hypothetical protein [Saccharothrix algeriensis]